MIVDQGADYVLPFTQNQPRLLEALQGLFDDPAEMRWAECDHPKTVDKGHGCLAIRDCGSTSKKRNCLRYPSTLADWRDLQCIAMLQAKRQLGDERTVTRRCYISSRKRNANSLLAAARTHWGIENKGHWVLDIALPDCTTILHPSVEQRSANVGSSESLQLCATMALYAIGGAGKPATYRLAGDLHTGRHLMAGDGPKGDQYERDHPNLARSLKRALANRVDLT